MIVDFILDLLPDDDYFYLFYLAGFSIITTIFLLYVAKKFKTTKPAPSNSPAKKEDQLTIDKLIKMVEDPKASPADLLVALQLYHANFRVENDVKKSLEFFKKTLFHKSRSKNLFDFFHGTILPANLKFKQELDKLEKEALDAS
jgi:hypothetical protein